MKHYIRVNESSEIVETGTIGPKDKPMEMPGTNIIYTKRRVMFDMSFTKGQWIDGALVLSQKDEFSTHSRQRQMSYPALGEQLDMLWHAMDQGQIPKAEPWYTQIKEVKQTYPKPG